ncbi:MAG TPA: hypothetical protein VE988_18115, partial [Gemmataceae bacterium]|nr:hypothetical protein [Gemmataceae bacterium]
RAWRQNIVMNVVLIAVISFLPNVSLAGHAGGGIAGAVISFPLCMARFDTGQRRWLGWVGAAAMVIVGLCLLYTPVMKRGDLPEVKTLRLMNEARRHANTEEEPDAKAKPSPHKKLEQVIKAAPLAKQLYDAGETAFYARNRALGKVLNGSSLKQDPVRAAQLAKSFQNDKAVLERYIQGFQKPDFTGHPALPDALKAGLPYFHSAAKLADEMAQVCAAGDRLSIEQRLSLQSELSALKDLEDAFNQAMKKLQE